LFLRTLRNGVDSAAQLIDVGSAGCRALLCKLHDEAAGCRLNPNCARSCGRSRRFSPGAGTTGERLAAEAALERVRARLTELGHKDSPVEMQLQRRNTVMIRAPRGFVDQVLWPEFGEVDRALQAYLHEVTLRVIRDEVFADASDAQEVPEALPPS
jgi:hypothetical protein